MSLEALRPFDGICAVLRARLRGTQLPAGFTSAFVTDPGVDRVWAAVASRHRITPALATSLSDLDLMESLPRDFQSYLGAMRTGNAARNQELRNQLTHVIGKLNSRGIAPCLLKGAARLVDGLFPSDEWRFMLDLDLLVPHERMEECVAALRADGYANQDGSESLDVHRHYPSLVHPDRLAPVELHRHLGYQVRSRLLPIEELWKRAQLLETPAGTVCLLAPQHHMMHLISHLQLDDGHWFQGLTRLQELVELDLLITRYRAAIDWPNVIHRFDRAAHRRVYLTVLCAASMLLGTTHPDVISGRFDRRTRLATARIIWQERWPLMMRMGLIYGWTAWQIHRRWSRRRFRAEKKVSSAFSHERKLGANGG